MADAVGQRRKLARVHRRDGLAAQVAARGVGGAVDRAHLLGVVGGTAVIGGGIALDHLFDRLRAEA